MPEETPMFRQYQEVKNKLAPGTILLFRLGDFFEMFDDDAKIGANILGLTLTARHARPMAGMPAHAAEGYIKKLLDAGRKVAVCDQREVAQAGKLVKRELTRVYTPGTALSAEHLRAEHNQYLLSIDVVGETLAASWMELSTGEWNAGATIAKDDFLTFLTLLQPAELIVPEENFPAGIKERLIENLPSLSVSELPNTFFEVNSAKKTLCEALNISTLKGFGLVSSSGVDHPAIGAAAALYHYAKQALCDTPQNLSELKLHNFEHRLIVEPNTARQLEIFKALDGSKNGSLINAMNSCVTAAGSRLLEKCLLAPECDVKPLLQRYDAIEAFISLPEDLKELRESLSLLRDLERILSRLQNRLRTPRELAATRDTLRALPSLITQLHKFSGQNSSPDSSTNSSKLSWIVDAIDPHIDLCRLLGQALEEEPSNDLTLGGFIRPGFDKSLDELKNLSTGHKVWIAELEKQEQERSGIKSLKVKYNNNFGFFIEVTNANLSRVPADYIRKSTTVNGERYVTLALQERQKEILGAESNAIARELEIFQTLVAQIIACASTLRQTAQALAWCDLLSSFAHNALTWNYVRPTIDDSTTLEIIEGRHPVVEQSLVSSGNGEKFVPNDTRMSAEADQILLITGPNMAGKSTYIRQNALIILMAQVGSFVPAKVVKVGLTDRIFSRIGSADALSRGESTFMVEMTETAYILRHATPKSLIILDEIGRGTSTYDGLSIAWAVAEYLHAHPKLGPRTLFATHYHELTRLEKSLPRLKNYTVAVKEWGSKIIFVRQVVPGTADRSYGVHVAQLAGIPDSVIARANQLLESLESQSKAPKQKTDKREEGQMSLFGV